MSQEERARIAEQRALQLAESRFRVLIEELAALARASEDAEKRLGATKVEVPNAFSLPHGDRVEIEAQNLELARVVRDARKRVNEAQAIAESERLNDYLRGLTELEVPRSVDVRFQNEGDHKAALLEGDPFPEENHTESAVSRAEKIVSRLEPGGSLSGRTKKLLGALRDATPGQASLILRELRTEVAKSNEITRRNFMLLEDLRELDARARAISDENLVREVILARGDLAKLSETRIARIREDITAAERRSETELVRENARLAMVAALRAVGYEVLPGFSTSVPEAGLLVSKPNDNHHAWKVDVRDSEINLEVVRTRIEADPDLTKSRDVAAEARMCGDFPVLLERLEAAGVEVGRLRQLDPGDSPVKLLAGALPAIKKKSSITRKPKERSV